jgi:DNA repair photolyase
MARLVSNPPNPWASAEVEWLGEPPSARLEVYEERARSILTANDSPDLALRWSVNPYRGCHHGCAYCFARRSHQYLGFGAGTDFERRIVVKVNAPDLLDRALARRDLEGEPLVFSGNTDAYQPLEASYRLTRRCLEVCLRHGAAVAVITKSALVRRDADLLARLAERGRATVCLSIPVADDEIARRLEPWAARPTLRFETLRVLSAAGIPTAVSLAPQIPGLTDHEIPRVLERARAAGATRCFMTMVRLAGEVRPVFEERLREAFPARATRVLGAIREVRGGALNDSRFGRRLKGEGPRWEAVETLFRLHARRLGYAVGEGVAQRPPAAAPDRPRQRALFDGEGTPAGGD